MPARTTAYCDALVVAEALGILLMVRKQEPRTLILVQPLAELLFYDRQELVTVVGIFALKHAFANSVIPLHFCHFFL